MSEINFETIQKYWPRFKSIIETAALLGTPITFAQVGYLLGGFARNHKLISALMDYSVDYDIKHNRPLFASMIGTASGGAYLPTTEFEPKVRAILDRNNIHERRSKYRFHNVYKFVMQQRAACKKFIAEKISNVRGTSSRPVEIAMI